MPTYEYPDTVVDPAILLDALLGLEGTAPVEQDGILRPVVEVRQTDDGRGAIVRVPPAVAQATVDALVSAHDPTVPYPRTLTERALARERLEQLPPRVGGPA